MKPWLFVGARVVCVDDSPTSRLGDRELSAGQEYTVRWVGEFLPWGYSAPVLCLRVEGIDRGPDTGCPNNPHWHDQPFLASRFRPVSTINTDAAVAALKQAMLDHVNNASGGLGIKRRVGA